jgi:hypothetical protein
MGNSRIEKYYDLYYQVQQYPRICASSKTFVARFYHQKEQYSE